MNAHVRDFERTIRQFKPSRIVFQIGGNDLDSIDANYGSAETIIHRIISISNLFLQRYNLEDVIIAQLLTRSQTVHCDLSLYNELVVAANRLLKDEFITGN